MLSKPRKTLFAGLGVAALLVTSLTAAAATDRRDDGRHRLHEVIDLSGPRGVESVRPGVTLVSEDDGTIGLVVERGRRLGGAVKFQLAELEDAAGFGNAVSESRGEVYYLTGGGGAADELPAGAATLYRLRSGELVPLADIKAHQKADPDPDDQEGVPTDTNPFGL
jgi:hypothetical protein